MKDQLIRSLHGLRNEIIRYRQEGSINYDETIEELEKLKDQIGKMIESLHDEMEGDRYVD